MESQSHLTKSINEIGLCVGPVNHIIIGDMFRPCNAEHSSIAPSFKDFDHVMY